MAHEHHHPSSCEHCHTLAHHDHHGHEHHDHEHHDHEHHGHEHHHHNESLREPIIKIAAATLLLIAAVIIERHTAWATWQYLLLYLVPYLIVGADTLKEAAEALCHGEALDENFLMSVATLGALAIGFLPDAATQFPEAVFVMLFFQVGELFEGIAEGKSRSSISHLMDLRPDSATLLKDDGTEERVAPEGVHPGDRILVRPGERVPLDGIVLDGCSNLDTVALTGESVPRSISEGGEILSGCVNLTSPLTVRVTKEADASTAARILDLVEDAAENKSASENFITRFARVYTPIVVALALALAIIPSLITGQWADWIYRSLMFLVVSCPCALVISVPLTFFGGIGGASRQGILVKGAAFMDTLASLSTVVFDKTGTLTEGVFEVTAVHSESLPDQELVHLAARVERYSTHPIAAALVKACPQKEDDSTLLGVEETAGKGVTALVDGHRVAVGNAALMEAEGVAPHTCDLSGTIIHVAMDGVYQGHIVISDRIKTDAPQAVRNLRSVGVSRCLMLTGDQESIAAAVARETGVDSFYAGLLPQDKVAKLEELLPLGKLAFVGDGINDAPVLTRADVGIAMGALGSDAAIEAADVVLMNDQPSKVAEAVRIARRTLRIARENMYFAIGIKLLVLLLAAFGIATLWMAVFADVGVTVLAVLNAMRSLRL